MKWYNRVSSCSVSCTDATSLCATNLTAPVTGGYPRPQPRSGLSTPPSAPSSACPSSPSVEPFHKNADRVWTHVVCTDNLLFPFLPDVKSLFFTVQWDLTVGNLRTFAWPVLECEYLVHKTICMCKRINVNKYESVFLCVDFFEMNIPTNDSTLFIRLCNVMHSLHVFTTLLLYPLQRYYVKFSNVLQHNVLLV